MNISNLTSCCFNPYTRSVTSNIKNTYVPEGVNLDFMFDKLRPIDDVVAGLKEPLKLADEFYVNKSSNELYISKGTTITVEGGFVFTVLEKGVTAGYGDINIPTPRDTDDQELRQAAQDMAGALSRLLRDASGITNVTQSESYPKWNQDICKLLEHLGIDTSKDFSVNGVKYTRNEDGYFESEHSFAAKEAYEILKNNNRSYTLADESTKNRVHYMSDYYLSSAPKEVRTAWKETLEETGINPFQAGYGSSLQQLAKEQDFAAGGNDQIFGVSIESSIEAIDKILERIANPLSVETEDEENNMMDPKQETQFYTTLRAKLAGMVDTGEETDNNSSEVPEKFANMSFEDILNSDYGRNAISTVNQIVSSRNILDGEICLTYFTDDRITCNYADGRKVWEIEINDEQQLEKIKEYFNAYTPDETLVNTEYHSGNDMSMAVQKNFWLDLFNN